jgi:hypothetical protein
MLAVWLCSTACVPWLLGAPATQPPRCAALLLPRFHPCRRSEAIVVPLQSNTPQDMDSNVQRMLAWLAAYKAQHGL